MNSRLISVTVLSALAAAALILASGTPGAFGSAMQPPLTPEKDAQRAVPATLQAHRTPFPENKWQSSPVMFIENAGQWHHDARFQVWGGPAGIVWLAEDAIWITILEPAQETTGRWPDKALHPRRISQSEDREDPTSKHGVNIKLSFIDANPSPLIETWHQLDTVVSYFYGNKPMGWRPSVPVWGGVRYVDLYPGVDLELTSNAGQLVSRLAVRSGANLDAVRLRVEGADAVALDQDGLRLSTSAREFTLPLLRADGSRIAGSKAVPTGAKGFIVTAPFVPASSHRESAIESQSSPSEHPVALLYSTFLGGEQDDGGYDITVDEAGAAYVTGFTWSVDFPTTPGALDPIVSAGDAFVVKLDPLGAGLVYATILGGSDSDVAYGIAVDGSGSAYITGRTASDDFPVKPGVFDPTFNGGTCAGGYCPDAFVAKLNPFGSSLTYATFLGSSDRDYGVGIDVDDAGSVYVVGYSYSANFPTTPNAFDPSHNGYWDAYVAKLNAVGSELIYSTFLGGTDYDWGIDIALDASGSAYVTGETSSSDFPTTPGALDTLQNGVTDAFLIKLNPAGSGLAYATFLGGSIGDSGSGIAVDRIGSVYVTGYTNSADFPATSEAFDPNIGNGNCGGAPWCDAFVARLHPSGNSLLYATFLGGNDTDLGSAIAIDEAGSAYVTGHTASDGFPTTPGALDPSFNYGFRDAFVVKLNPTGSWLNYATFLGGSDWDEGKSIVTNGDGEAYVTGYTISGDFPVTPAAFDPNFNSGDCGGRPCLDAVVVRLHIPPLEELFLPLVVSVD